MRWIWEPTSPFMLKFGLEIDFGVIQKLYAAIFEILIFRDFSGGKVQNFIKMKAIASWNFEDWKINDHALVPFSP